MNEGSPEPVVATPPDALAGVGALSTEGIALATFVFYVIAIVLLVRFVIPLPVLIEQVGALGVWAPLTYIVLYVLRGFIYFPGGAFLVASGVLFTPLMGSIYYLAGIVLSASLSHFLGGLMRARGWFPRLRHRLDAPEQRDRIRRHGFRAVFVIHLFGVSFDIPNYLSGYLGLEYRRFLLSVVSANLLVVLLFHLALRLIGLHC